MSKQVLLTEEECYNDTNNEDEDKVEEELEVMVDEVDNSVQQDVPPSSEQVSKRSFFVVYCLLFLMLQVATGSQETLPSLSNIILICTTLAKAELYNTQLQDRALFKDLQERKVAGNHIIIVVVILYFWLLLLLLLLPGVFQVQEKKVWILDSTTSLLSVSSVSKNNNGLRCTYNSCIALTRLCRSICSHCTLTKVTLVMIAVYIV